MAVPVQTPYVEYIANGISTQFSVPFQCLSKNTLIVSIDGVETLPQLWNFNSGEIIFITAPLDNSTVSIKRTTSLKREVTYDSYSNSMLPTVFNGDFDRIWHALQEQSYKLGQYDFDYSYAVNTSNQANQKSDQANQKADLALEGLETVSTETQPILRGGTGATTVEDARENLDVNSKAEVLALIQTGGGGNVIDIAIGGTGATTVEDARENLDVNSKEEVATAISNAATPDAEENVKGKAEIATQAETNTGTDDLRFITPKKLLAGVKNHLNATGGAPLFACRAWVNFNGTTNPPTIKSSGNVLSVVRLATGQYQVNFITAMPTQTPSVYVTTAKLGTGSYMSGDLMNVDAISSTSVKVQTSFSNAAADVAVICVGVFC